MNIAIIGLGYWGPNIVRNVINNKRDISKMKSLKVDGIITDFPDRF